MSIKIVAFLVFCLVCEFSFQAYGQTDSHIVFSSTFSYGHLVTFDSMDGNEETPDTDVVTGFGPSKFHPTWGTLTSAETLIVSSAASGIAGIGWESGGASLGFYAYVNGPAGFNSMMASHTYTSSNGSTASRLSGPYESESFGTGGSFIGFSNLDHYLVSLWEGNSDAISGGSATGTFFGHIIVDYAFVPSGTGGPLPGDVDLDGQVSRDDYLAVTDSLANPPEFPGWNHGDFDQNGVVDLSDYLILQSHFHVGDMNGDSAVNSFDATAFGTALTNLSAYHAQYPTLIGEILGDVNGDGNFDAFDVAPFEALLSGGGSFVPSPSSIVGLLMCVSILGRPNHATAARFGWPSRE